MIEVCTNTIREAYHITEPVCHPHLGVSGQAAGYMEEQNLMQAKFLYSELSVEIFGRGYESKISLWNRVCG